MRFRGAIILLLLCAVGASAQATFTYSGGTSVVPASYFGMTCNNASSFCIPVGVERTWDNPVSWADLESSSGTYSWTALDGLVSEAAAAGIPDIVYTIGNVPAFNSSNPSGGGCAEGAGTCYPNASTTEFITFANAITQRYCGKIQYWEGWNEANGSASWNASIALLVTYMNAYYTAAHSTSNCACVGSFSAANCAPAKVSGVNLNKVLLPAMSQPGYFTATELNNGSAGYNLNLTYWLTSYLAAGGKNYYDFAALHSYGTSATCYSGPEVYVTDVASFKQVLAVAGLSTQSLWATELNWGQNSCIANTDAVLDSWIARYMILHWAMGFSRAIWYAYLPAQSFPPSGFGSIIAGTNQLVTYQDMQKWLTGAVFPVLVQFGNGNWVGNLTRSSPSGYQAAVAWNSTGSGSYTTPAYVTQCRDVLNNITAVTGGATISLTASPQLCESASAF
jgi:hypothetical protein